jgi:hypothetical protein
MPTQVGDRGGCALLGAAQGGRTADPSTAPDDQDRRAARPRSIDSSQARNDTAPSALAEALAGGAGRLEESRELALVAVGE